MKKFLLRFIKLQTLEQGDCITTYKILFGKIYITSQRVEESFYINHTAIKKYLKNYD